MSNTCLKAGAEPHVYKTVNGRQLSLYVLSPNEHILSCRRPAIAFFHGGSWTSGAPGEFTGQSKYFVSRGMVCAQVEYRLLNKETTEPPEICIADAKSAIRWLRGHAENLGIDTNRIVAAGASAGGHLAAAAATITGCNDPMDALHIDPKPNALALFAPVYNNGPDGGWGAPRIGDRYEEFSPAYNIRKGMPPAIVFLGSVDIATKVSIAEKFRDDMKAVGSRSELVIFEGQGHGIFDFAKEKGRWFRRTVLAMDTFFVSLGYLDGEPIMKLEPGDEE